MGAAMAAHGYPSTTIVKKQPNAQFTRLMNEYREMVGLDVFASGGNEIVSAAKALKKKKLLGFLADRRWLYTWFTGSIFRPRFLRSYWSGYVCKKIWISSSSNFCIS